jgi:integrase
MRGTSKPNMQGHGEGAKGLPGRAPARRSPEPISGGSKVLDLRGPAKKRALPDYLEGAIEDYLRNRSQGLDGRRACSPTTLSGYAYALRKVLLPYMRELRLASWEDLTTEAVSHLRRRLYEQGGARGPVSGATANTYCRHIGYFLRWLHREGETPEPIRIQVTAEASRAALALDADEIDAVLDAATNDRDRLIVALLADTGIRISELCTLRYDRLDRSQGAQLIRVLGKGGQGLKEREVPLIRPGMLRHIERYIAATGGRTPERAYVFLGKRADRRTGELEPLTPSGVQKLLRELRQRAGLEKPLTPHILRHTFITRALNAGVDPISIARGVGHRDLRMLMTHYDRRSTLDYARALETAMAKERRRAI